MKEKLTLSIDKDVKQRAKRYAKKTGDSVSQIVENYPDGIITENETFEPEPGSITESLMGSLELPEKYSDMDYKEIKKEIVREKYDN